MSEKAENTHRSGWGCLGCGFIFLAVCALGLAAVIILICMGVAQGVGSVETATNSPYDPASLEEIYAGGTPVGKAGPVLLKIAIIDVEGVILSNSEDAFSRNAESRAIRLRIQRAAKDPDVRALVINLNTPGGEVTAADEIYNALCLFREKTKKPVIAMMNSMAASGGYYIASACKPIVANKNTLTGSIGVIISTYNYSGLFQKLGLQSEVYASGKMKDMLNGARVRTPEEIEVVQKLVDDTYSDFVKIVSVSRNIPEEKIRTTEIGDGRVLDGRQALKLGLVDKLGYFSDAVQCAAEAAKIGKKPYTLIRYKESFSFGKLCSMLFSKARPVRVSLHGENEFVPKRGMLYYLPAGF